MDGRGGGLTLLDGAALVIGAAVASAHVRGAFPGGLSGAGWAFVWITFAGIALTAAGPFVFLARRYWRRPPNYPRAGDRLWAVLGLPWVLIAPLRTSPPDAASRPVELTALMLFFGIGAACLTSLVVIWKTWIMTPPEAPEDRAPVAWTDRVGLILAVAWPIQCGFGLVILG